MTKNWCVVHGAARSVYTPDWCLDSDDLFECVFESRYNGPPIGMSTLDNIMGKTYMPQLKAQLEIDSWLLSRMLEDKSRLGIRTRIYRKVRAKVWRYRQNAGYRAFRLLTGHDVPDEEY